MDEPWSSTRFTSNCTPEDGRGDQTPPLLSPQQCQDPQNEIKPTDSTWGRGGGHRARRRAKLRLAAASPPAGVVSAAQHVFGGSRRPGDSGETRHQPLIRTSLENLPPTPSTGVWLGSHTYTHVPPNCTRHRAHCRGTCVRGHSLLGMQQIKGSYQGGLQGILFSSFCLYFLIFLQITHITYVTLLSLGKTLVTNTAKSATRKQLAEIRQIRKLGKEKGTSEGV